MNASSRLVSIALAAAASAAQAQVGTTLDAPPRLPPAATQPAPAAGGPRIVIRLPERERAPAREHDDEPLAEPAPQAQWPAARQISADVRIEQRRRANRVVEVIVTPAGSTTSYVIVNREGARPLSPHELSAGLSVPGFLRLEF